MPQTVFVQTGSHRVETNTSQANKLAKSCGSHTSGNLAGYPPAKSQFLAGEHAVNRVSSRQPFLLQWLLKVKSTVVDSLARTVTVSFCVPKVEVQASRVYSPGGTPLIVKVPSLPVTA